MPFFGVLREGDGLLSSVFGVVTDEAGDPLAGIAVYVGNQDFSWYDSMVTGTNGTYNMDAPADWVHLVVQEDATYFGFHDYFRLEVGEAREADIVLREKGPQTSTIKGTVLDRDTGGPVDGAVVGVDLLGTDWHGEDVTDDQGRF